MRHVDLAITAKFVIPVEPAGVLHGHTVLVDAGRIVAIAPPDVAGRDFLPRTRIDLPRHALLPGLVNAHTHSAMSLLRGVADDLHLDDWLRGHIWPREARFVTPEFVYDGVLLAAHEMLTGGITCCNDMYFYPDAAARAYQAAGLRAVLGLPVLDFPTPYASDGDAYLQAGLAARDAFKYAPRLTWMMAPHAPYTVGDAMFEKIVTFARQLDLPIQTHLQETRGELEAALAATGETPLARLDRLGATGPGIRRDSRGAPRTRRRGPACRAGLQRRALPGLQHEARERHRAGDRTRRGRRQCRARNGRCGVQQPSRPLRRDAPRLAARQGRNG